LALKNDASNSGLFTLTLLVAASR